MSACSQTSVVRANDDYYVTDDDNSNNNYNYNNANYGDDGNNNHGDDGNANAYAYASSNATGDNNKNGYGEYVDDWASENANVADDDLFHWNSNVGFDGVSMMPVSCIN